MSLQFVVSLQLVRVRVRVSLIRLRCSCCGVDSLDSGNEAFKAGQWKKAIEGYTRAIDIDPDNKVRRTSYTTWTNTLSRQAVIESILFIVGYEYYCCGLQGAAQRPYRHSPSLYPLRTTPNPEYGCSCCSVRYQNRVSSILHMTLASLCLARRDDTAVADARCHHVALPLPTSSVLAMRRHWCAAFSQ